MSSTGLASICLSTGLASNGENVPAPSASFPVRFGVVPDGLLVGEAALLVDLPFLNLLNDSLKDFLNDLRREIGVSPAPERSK